MKNMITKRLVGACFFVVSCPALSSGMTHGLAKELLLVDEMGNRVHLKRVADRVECLELVLGRRRVSFDCSVLSKMTEPDLQETAIYSQEVRGRAFNQLVIPYFEMESHDSAGYEVVLDLQDGVVLRAYVRTKGNFVPLECFHGECANLIPDG